MQSTKKLLEKDPIKVFKWVLDGRLKKFPHGFWNTIESMERSAHIVRFLIENILGWDKEDVKKRLCLHTFEEYRLRGMMACLFGESPYLAIENAYPGVFLEWELHNCPINFWNREKAIEAVEWMLEIKLKWTDEEIIKKFNKETFLRPDINLGGMLKHVFNNSSFEAINAAYPGKFLEWQFSRVPKEFWNSNENIKKAIKWLCEKFPVGYKISSKDFKANGLKYLLQERFNWNVEEALSFAGITRL